MLFCLWVVAIHQLLFLMLLAGSVPLTELYYFYVVSAQCVGYLFFLPES